MENETQNYEALLTHYKNDPYYGKCYEGIIDGLNLICIVHSCSLDLQTCVNVFTEAEESVNRVLNSNFKDIEILNVHSGIMNKYGNVENKLGEIQCTNITAARLIGYLIDQVYLIVLWDKMDDRSNYTKRFEDCRAYINSRNDSINYRSTSLWKLLAERLPKIKERPRIEDLEVEIANLQELLEKENRASLNCVTYLMDKLIYVLSRTPKNLKDIDKARFIEKVSGYKEKSITSILSKQKLKDGIPSEKEQAEIRNMLSTLSIPLKFE